MTKSEPRSTRIYPRLPDRAARQILVEREGWSLDDRYAASELTHPAATVAPVGGHPADAHLLTQVRDVTRAIAAAAGYPRPPTERTRLQFDLECGTELYRIMDIVPADAAVDAVWSFVTIVLIPEIAPWRFGSAGAEERYLGRPRNTLRRLWWRAWSLGPDLTVHPEGCSPLGEDEYVQIMERTSLGGDRATAVAMRDAIWRAQASGLPAARSEVVRRFALRVRARRSHLCLDALDRNGLDQLMTVVMADSIATFN